MRSHKQRSCGGGGGASGNLCEQQLLLQTNRNCICGAVYNRRWLTYRKTWKTEEVCDPVLCQFTSSRRGPTARREDKDSSVGSWTAGGLAWLTHTRRYNCCLQSQSVCSTGRWNTSRHTVQPVDTITGTPHTQQSLKQPVRLCFLSFSHGCIHDFSLFFSESSFLLPQPKQVIILVSMKSEIVWFLYQVMNTDSSCSVVRRVISSAYELNDRQLLSLFCVNTLCNTRRHDSRPSSPHDVSLVFRGSNSVVSGVTVVACEGVKSTVSTHWR